MGNFFKNLGIGETYLIKEWFDNFKTKYRWSDTSISLDETNYHILVNGFQRHIINNILDEDVPPYIIFDFQNFAPADGQNTILGVTNIKLNPTQITERLNKININGLKKIGMWNSQNGYNVYIKSDDRWTVKTIN